MQGEEIIRLSFESMDGDIGGSVESMDGDVGGSATGRRESTFKTRRFEKQTRPTFILPHVQSASEHHVAEKNEVLLSAGCCFNDVEFLLTESGFGARNFGHLVAVTDVKLFRLRFADLRKKHQQYLSFLEKLWRCSGHALCVRSPELFNYMPPTGWDWGTVMLSSYEAGVRLGVTGCVLVVSGVVEQSHLKRGEEVAAMTTHTPFSFIMPLPDDTYTVLQACRVLSHPGAISTLAESCGGSSERDRRSLSLARAPLARKMSRVERRSIELSRPMPGLDKRLHIGSGPESMVTPSSWTEEGRGKRHLWANDDDVVPRHHSVDSTRFREFSNSRLLVKKSACSRNANLHKHASLRSGPRVSAIAAQMSRQLSAPPEALEDLQAEAGAGEGEGAGGEQALNLEIDRIPLELSSRASRDTPIPLNRSTNTGGDTSPSAASLYRKPEDRSSNVGGRIQVREEAWGRREVSFTPSPASPSSRCLRRGRGEGRGVGLGGR